MFQNPAAAWQRAAAAAAAAALMFHVARPETRGRFTRLELGSGDAPCGVGGGVGGGRGPVALTFPFPPRDR